MPPGEDAPGEGARNDEAVKRLLGRGQSRGGAAEQKARGIPEAQVGFPAYDSPTETGFSHNAGSRFVLQ